MSVFNKTGLGQTRQNSFKRTAVCEQVGFGYSVTGAVEGLTGDQNRTDPILLALMEAVRASDDSPAAKL
jgi:hypothetical protein